MPERYRSLETKLIHAGEPRPRPQGAVAMPVYQSSTYLYEGQGDYHDLKYIRLNNTPNHDAVSQKLAALENAEAGLVTASGMAAISTALLTFLHPGDHLLAQDTLYGGTHELLTHDFESMKIDFDPIDGNDPASWKSKLRSQSKVIYVETITNPLIKVADLQAVVDFARKHDLISMIDNTFASPVNFRPAEWGFDLSLHSCTKYLNGHSDIVAGAVIGREDLVTRVRHRLNHLGGSLDPHACNLLHRGMKTLALRVGQQNRNAQTIAEFLARQPTVKSVNHPGLEEHPSHAMAERYLDGFGGMLSFEVHDGVEAARQFIERTNLPYEAPSLGGVETLVTLPATTSHAGIAPEERRALGVSDSLIRLSVGIEAVDDLVEDFEQALTV